MRTVVTGSEQETAAVAEALAGKLRAGSVLLVAGPLGAGKTAFVRGLVKGLGGDPGEVSSPTFTLVQRYAARVPVQHADLYRLAPPEVADLGLDDLGEGHVLAVEWPDRWNDPPPDAIAITIELRGETERSIKINSADE